MTTVILNPLYLLNYFRLLPHVEPVLDRLFIALKKIWPILLCGRNVVRPNSIEKLFICR